MKKRIAYIILTTFLMVLILPTSVSAYGGYYAIKGEKVFHSVTCLDVMGYRLEDLKHYETESAAKKAGLKSADCCTDDMFDFESDGSTVWFSDDAKWQNALELERMFGVFDGYDAGLEEGKTVGYEAGREMGFEAGYDNGYSEGYADAKNELEEKYKKDNKLSKILLIVVIAIFGLPVITTIAEIFLNFVEAFKKKS